MKNIKDIAENTARKAQERYVDIKQYSSNIIMPKAKDTKKYITNSAQKVKEKISTTITEEEMINILNTLYIKSIDGIPKVSLPIDDLVNDYISKNSDVHIAAKSLINNSIVKCGTSGFLSGLGGLGTMILSLPANITSVIYVQLRMCCAIAKMAGYDIHSDQVQTMIYACLTGSAVTDVLKNVGIQFGTKFSTSLISKIPGKTLTAINQKVGFRFVTKFGSKGLINLGKAVPIVGGVVGGSIDATSTKIIGYNAYKIFVTGELSKKDQIDDNFISDEIKIVDEDIDIKMIKDLHNAD